MGVTAFRQQCEKFLGILDDSVILENYVRMFGNLSETDLIKPENFKDLMRTCYNLAMAHYQDGPQSCLLVSFAFPLNSKLICFKTTSRKMLPNNEEG